MVQDHGDQRRADSEAVLGAASLGKHDVSFGAQLERELTCFRHVVTQCKRVLTVRELARSQGFPDHFQFYYVTDQVVKTVSKLLCLRTESVR